MVKLAVEVGDSQHQKLCGLLRRIPMNLYKNTHTSVSDQSPEVVVVQPPTVEVLAVPEEFSGQTT